MTRQALIVVDIQNDYFPQGKWPLVGAEAAADNAARLLAAFREAGDPVPLLPTISVSGSLWVRVGAIERRE